MERTTYLVITMGESVFKRTSCSIWETLHEGESALGTHAGVVHQAINRPEVFAHLLHQVCDAFDFREIKRHKMERPRISICCGSHRSSEFTAFFARNRDGPEPRIDQPAGDAQAYSPASARNQYITHDGE